MKQVSNATPASLPPCGLQHRNEDQSKFCILLDVGDQNLALYTEAAVGDWNILSFV